MSYFTSSYAPWVILYRILRHPMVPRAFGVVFYVIFEYRVVKSYLFYVLLNPPTTRFYNLTTCCWVMLRKVTYVAGVILCRISRPPMLWGSLCIVFYVILWFQGAFCVVFYVLLCSGGHSVSYFTSSYGSRELSVSYFTS